MRKVFDQKKNNFRGMQNKKPFEIILHVELVTSLQSWVAKKKIMSWSNPYECFIFDYPSHFEGLFLAALHAIMFQTVFCFAFLRSHILISDKKVKAKSNRNGNCIFSSSWESQGGHIGPFLLCFTYPP